MAALTALIQGELMATCVSEYLYVNFLLVNEMSSLLEAGGHMLAKYVGDGYLLESYQHAAPSSYAPELKGKVLAPRKWHTRPYRVEI